MEIDVLAFLANTIAGKQDAELFNTILQDPFPHVVRILDDALSESPILDYSNHTNNSIIFITLCRLANATGASSSILSQIIDVFLLYNFDFSIFSDLFSANSNNEIFSETSDQLFLRICEEGFEDVNLVIRYIMCSVYKSSSKLNEDETYKFLEILDYYLTNYNQPNSLLFFNYNIKIWLSFTREVVYENMEQFSTIIEKNINAIHTSEIQYQHIFIKQLAKLNMYIDKELAESIIEGLFDSEYLTGLLEQKTSSLALVITHLFEYFENMFCKNQDIEPENISTIFEFCVLAADYNNFDADISASKDMFYYDMFGEGERHKLQTCFFILVNYYGIEIDQDIVDSLKTCENGLYLLASFIRRTDNEELRTAIIEDVRPFLAENSSEGDTMYQLAAFYFNSQISQFVDDDYEQIIKEYSSAIDGFDEQPELMSVVITLLINTMLAKPDKMVFGDIIEDVIDNQRNEHLCDQLSFMILTSQFLSNPECPDQWADAVPTILSLFLSFIFGHFVMLGVEDERAFNSNDFTYISFVDEVFRRWYSIIDTAAYRNVVDAIVGYFQEDESLEPTIYTDFDVYTAIYALSGVEYEPPEGSEPQAYEIEETYYSFHEIVEGLRWCPLQEGCEDFMILLVEMLDQFSECRIYTPHAIKLKMLLHNSPNSFRAPIGAAAAELSSRISLDFVPDENTIAIDVVAGALICALKSVSYAEAIEPVVALIEFIFCNYEISEPIPRLSAAAEFIEPNMMPSDESEAISSVYNRIIALIQGFEGQGVEVEVQPEE